MLPQLASRSITHDVAHKSLRYLLILDFEATCSDSKPAVGHEIIEFPTLLYNIHEKKVQATFHEYVRPVQWPVLTEFCTSLTGIPQETVDRADTFPEVWSRFNEFLTSHGVFDDPMLYAFLTCGDWDLKTMLPKQLDYEGAKNPAFSSSLDLPLKRWINVKKSFRNQYKVRNNRGMTGMLKHLKIPLEGRHHSGIDDCRNIARIVQRMQKDGWKPGASDLSP